jgi:hypothetical protein
MTGDGRTIVGRSIYSQDLVLPPTSACAVITSRFIRGLKDVGFGGYEEFYLMV